MQATILQMKSNGVHVVLSTGHILRVRSKDFLATANWGPKQKVSFSLGNKPFSVSICNHDTGQTLEMELENFFPDRSQVWHRCGIEQ